MKVLSEYELSSIAHRLIGLVRDGYNKEVKGSLYTRCRDLYGFLYYSGTLSTLGFAYSKATENLVKQCFRWIVSSLENEAMEPPTGKKEDLGYALYASFMMYLFKKLFKGTDLEVKNASIDEVIKIISNESYVILLDDYSLRFAKWLKRYAEALLEER